jgi:hypothetical protein
MQPGPPGSYTGGGGINWPVRNPSTAPAGDSPIRTMKESEEINFSK